MIRYIFHKRPPAHKINLNVWSVENAEVLPFVYLFCNIGEGFIDIPYHLRVNSNLNIKRQFLTNDEVIFFKECEYLFKKAVAYTEGQLVKLVSMKETAVEIGG